ncbi:MAG: type II toxin-antitoxin system HicA family toxin [Gammaproteobacteria bacterium]
MLYSVNSREFKRWLERQGATFKPGRGGHLRVFLKGRQSVLPMHSGELKKGTVEGIKNQLSLE